MSDDEGTGRMERLRRLNIIVCSGISQLCRSITGILLVDMQDVHSDQTYTRKWILFSSAFQEESMKVL